MAKRRASSTPASTGNTQPSPQTQTAEMASTAATSDSHEAQQPDSHATPHTEPTGDEGRENASPAAETDAGNVPSDTTDGETASPLNYAHVRSRLMTHSEWKRVIATVREMRADPKLANMSAEMRERFIWGEMDRLYPPMKEMPPSDSSRTLSATLPGGESNKTGENSASTHVADKGSVRGLGDIPTSWPPLPANAALSAELGWVQANRLYVVEELASGGTRVHLDRAHEPSPSRSAIGWLETSIRSYAKFVEVAAKASGSGDGDGEQVKRERMAIEEIRGLLAEMAGNPPGAGR